LILALFLVSVAVMELILRGERKKDAPEKDEGKTFPLALERRREAHPARLEAPLAAAPAEGSGIADDLLALADAVPNEALTEVPPEPRSPQSKQPQYNQPQYNQEDARVE
jgi:hypothetical protein